jgi:sigma-B regulation protein RsbU (phosphoserine phosphatase)
MAADDDVVRGQFVAGGGEAQAGLPPPAVAAYAHGRQEGVTPPLVNPPILVLSPDGPQGRQIVEWLRAAGLGAVASARTSDEAIFMLGRGRPSLLIVDEDVPWSAERRLLRHIETNHGAHDVPAAPRPAGGMPVLVRLVHVDSPRRAAMAGQPAAEIIQKPLRAHDVVVQVGTAMQRPDLLGRLDQASDQAARHLEAARQMQLGLLPTGKQIDAVQAECGVGMAALYRPGEAVGGDFWGAWATGEGGFALAIVDFTGHGLSAALNTFRLHALLSEPTLPRARPAAMTALLNERLHGLLPRGHYATMIYLHIDPRRRRVDWSSAGGPPPLFVSGRGATDLAACGLPLGIRQSAAYQSHSVAVPGAGVLAVFSDGLFESGAGDLAVPRDAIAGALAGAARLAEAGELAAAAAAGTAELDALRGRYPCRDHSDDIMAICVAFGPEAS